jgi:hypothetical protein
MSSGSSADSRAIDIAAVAHPSYLDAFRAIVNPEQARVTPHADSRQLSNAPFRSAEFKSRGAPGVLRQDSTETRWSNGPPRIQMRRRRGALTRSVMVGERGRYLNRLPVFETSALALIRRHQDVLRAAPSWVARVKDKEHC